MSGINSSAWTPSEVIGGLTLAFAVLSAIGWLIYLIINDPADRRAIAAWLEKAPLWEGYRRGVGWGLERLERFYGGAFTWRAFDRCLLIAFFYPIFFYFVAWVAGSSATPSDIFHLPSEWPRWQRLLLTTLLLCLVVLMTWFLWNRDRTKNAERGIALRLRNRAGLSRKSIWILRGAAISAVGVSTYLVTKSWILAIITAFFGAVGTALVGGVNVVLFSAGFGAVGIVLGVGEGGIGTLAFLLAGTVGIVLGGAGAVAVAVGIVLGIAFLVAVAGAVGDAVFLAEADNFFLLNVGWIFFLVVLPSLNAVADYLSFGVSRQLLQAVAENTGHWRLARHVGYDIALAFFFLFLLAGLLLSGTVLYAQLLSTRFDADLAWQPFLQAAQDEPFGGGLSVTLMLFSTLVPTLAHLLVAAMALLVRSLPGQHTIAAWLEVDGDVQTSRKIGTVAWMMIVVTGGLAGLSAIGYGIWTLISFLTGDTIGEYLYAFATCSAALVSDVPCVMP